jgi:hypothetical protein
MNVLEYATRDDLPEAAELRRQLQEMHTVAVCVIKTARGLTAAQKRDLVDALNRELTDA